MSDIQKVEIVQPVHKGLPKTETVAKLITALLIALPIKTLFVFWFVATWYPQWGLTFWELLLPVYIAGFLFQPLTRFRGRWIPENRLFKLRYDHGQGVVEEQMIESRTNISKDVQK